MTGDKDKYQLKDKAGEIHCTGTYNECLGKLHGVQGQSWDYALKYEGWKIVPAEKDSKHESEDPLQVVDKLLGEGSEGANISDVVSALKGLLKMLTDGRGSGNPYTKPEVNNAILVLHSFGEYPDAEYAEELLKSRQSKSSKIAQRNQRLFPKTEGKKTIPPEVMKRVPAKYHQYWVEYDPAAEFGDDVGLDIFKFSSMGLAEDFLSEVGGAPYGDARVVLAR